MTGNHMNGDFKVMLQKTIRHIIEDYICSDEGEKRIREILEKIKQERKTGGS